MGEMTLDDLVDSDSNDSGSSGGSGGTGEWVNNLIDKLDEKGILEPMVFGEQRSMDDIQGERGANNQGSQQSAQQATAGDSAGPELDADQLKSIMLELYDRTGMIPGLDDDPKLSDLIKLVDGNPDLVDQMINEYL